VGTGTLEHACVLAGGLGLLVRHTRATAITAAMAVQAQPTSTVLSVSQTPTATTTVPVSATHSGTAQAVCPGAGSVTHAVPTALDQSSRTVSHVSATVLEGTLELAQAHVSATLTGTARPAWSTLASAMRTVTAATSQTRLAVMTV
jgi:hypothetical protein